MRTINRSMSSKSKKGKSARSITAAQVKALIAERTSLSKKDVASVLEALVAVVAEELKAGNPVTVPGLVKVKLVRKPARPARPGRNPFTGEAITIKAKPARNAVKVSAIKALKDLA